MKTLISEDEVRRGVQQLAVRLNEEYGRHPLTAIAVMTGSLVFLADLIRLLQMPLRVGVVQASSYRGTERGKLAINAEMMPDITGHNVLLVDDIFDTGHTLEKVVAEMRRLHPTSLRTAVLLHKEGRQQVDMKPDYTVFTIPNEFVVGYGLDHNDEFRNLNYVAVLEQEDLA